MRKVAASAGTILAGMALAVVTVGAARASAEKNTKKPATVENVVKALAYDETSDLGRALTDVSDGTDQWRETAFFLLLGRVGKLAPLGPGEMARLDRPAYRSLMTEPKRYRCRPMRMRVRVHTVKKMTGRQLGASDAIWPVDKPVWRLFCSDASLPVDEGTVVVCSTVEPAGLGEPSDKDRRDRARFEEDELIYKQAPEIELACVFYKTYRDTQKGAAGRRDYPVVIAWQAGAAADGKSLAVGTDPRYVVGAMVILAVCIAYYFVRRYTRRFAKPGPNVQYRPKRDDIDDAQGPDAAGPDRAEQEDDQPVDPLLAAAAEQYQREREQRDAPDHR